MLKNSDGKKSATFTMMIVAFAIISLWLLVSIVAKIGHLEIRPFSSSEAMAYFVPIAALYFGRRSHELVAVGSTKLASPTVPSATALSE